MSRNQLSQNVQAWLAEPLPDGHPLWAMPSVIITPHVAAASDDLGRRLRLVVAENVRRYVAGERMLSVVDLDRGY